MLATEAGRIAWRAQLDVYGVPREEQGVAAAEERTANPWRFPGQYEDAETGLYYNRFRYYDPELGRYLSEDPIGLSGGVALFGYVYDPLVWLDVLGLSGCKARAKQNLRDLGLDGVELAGASLNRGRRQLLAAGFVEAETTATGRVVFRHPTRGSEVFFDSGKALVGHQKPHWHVRDRGGRAFDRGGREVERAEGAGHIPAG